MKKFFSLVVLSTLILASCGTKDPQAQLEALKAERSALDVKIQELEAQLSQNGGAEVKTKDVLTTKIAPSLFKHFIDVQGVVDAESQAAVQPQMPGVITKI